MTSILVPALSRQTERLPPLPPSSSSSTPPAHAADAMLTDLATFAALMLLPTEAEKGRETLKDDRESSGVQQKLAGVIASSVKTLKAHSHSHSGDIPRVLHRPTAPSSAPVPWSPIPSSPLPLTSSASHFSSPTPLVETILPLSPLDCPVLSVKHATTPSFTKLGTCLNSLDKPETIDLPPTPPRSPPSPSLALLSVSASDIGSFQFTRCHTTAKAYRGRSPVRAREGATHARSPSRRSGSKSPPPFALSSIPESVTSEGEDDSQQEDDDDCLVQFQSLPLLRLRNRLTVSLTLSAYAALSSPTSPPSSRPRMPSQAPAFRRKRRPNFAPGTVWSEQSHYRLYALGRAKSERTGGDGYWRSWEGIDLE
ncbi:hypothetical protein JCM1841_006189 [Sporobolomyces salmonicolor]